MKISLFKKQRSRALSAEDEARILHSILLRSGKKPNTVSLESLRSYSNYRQERYTLARVLISVILVLFLLLPLLFFRPRLIIQERTDVLENRRAYNITVECMIPIGRITAEQNGRTVPIYEAAGTEYIILPNENGEVLVTVTLKNGQYKTEGFTVSGIDRDPPSVIRTEIIGSQLYLYLEDDSEIDAGTINIVTESGEPVNIIRYITADKCIVLPMPGESSQLTIADIYGNSVTIKLNI